MKSAFIIILVFFTICINFPSISWAASSTSAAMPTTVNLNNNTSILRDYIPLIISVMSLVISLIASAITLWKLYLSPFKLLSTTSTPFLALYVLDSRNKKRKNYILSINVGVSFNNIGARIGKILDMRIVADTNQETISSKESKQIIFVPKWNVNFSKFYKNRTDRFHWIKNCVESYWHSFFLLPHSPISKHLIFEPFDISLPREGDYQFIMYVKTDKKWEVVESFRMPLTEDVIASMKKGDTFGLINDNEDVPSSRPPLFVHANH